MSLLAPRLERIRPSISQAATQRARELRAAGRDIIGLASGEPDFDTPAHICDAATAAMARGETRYTNVDGTAELKAAVVEKFKRENGLDYSPDQISIGSGAKQVVYNSMMASLAPGDEVIVPAPHWLSYTEIALLAEGTPVVVPCGQNQGFRLTPEALEAAITPRTKWLVINSPSNPTGAAYDADELKALAAVLLRHPHVHILTDDIYEHILFDGRSFATIAAIEPRLYERTLTVNGVSKTYAMTGWRIGFAGGPRPLIKAMAKLQSQSTSNPSSVGQAAALAALTGPQHFIPERAASFQARRDKVVALLNQVPGINCHKPEGAFYLYPSCAGLIGKRQPDGKRLATDEDVVIYLLEKADVAVVQGSAYGMSPHFRVSIASSLELLEAACERIARACAALE
ncbi:MAG: aminotransferase class I/II-fold pyridoxal phosphate-dependent enzyme [Proteobacteria bacterium]|nr:aminotransferase class I/II-fold pyridoxal phosphate-dependent enzyme [Pseudomonadota bacterium]